jgi:hypothetical protein
MGLPRFTSEKHRNIEIHHVLQLRQEGQAGAEERRGQQRGRFSAEGASGGVGEQEAEHTKKDWVCWEEVDRGRLGGRRVHR